MSGYVLTPTAQQDLLQIRDYYWEQAGYRLARQVLTEFVGAFQFLGRTPGAGTNAKTWRKPVPSSSGRCEIT